LISVVVLLVPILSFAQLSYKNVNTFKIQVSDGLHQSRVDQMIYDDQGILWLSLKNKLQLWDGQEVITVHDTIIEMASQFNLYKHPKEGIVVTTPGLIRQFSYEDFEKKTLYQSKGKTDLTEVFSPAPIFKDGRIKYVVTRDSLVSEILNSKAYKVNSLWPNGKKCEGGGCELSIDDHNYIQMFANNLLINKGSFLASSIDMLVNAKWLRSNYSFASGKMVFTTNSSLVVLNKGEKKVYRFPEEIEEEYYSTVMNLSSSTYVVGVDNRLFLFDIEKGEWIHEYRDVSNEKLLKSGFFDKTIIDKYGNLWAVTVNEGLIKIYLGNDFEYIGTGDSDKNFIKNIEISYTSNMIVTSGLNNGIFVYDTLGNIIHEINSETTNGKVHSVTGIYEVAYKRYIFNQNNDFNLYELDLNKKKPRISILGRKEHAYLYYQDAVTVDENMKLLLFNNLYELNTITYDIDTLFRHRSTKSCMIQDGDLVWIGANDAIIKYNWKQKSELEYISLPGEGYVRSIQIVDGNSLIYGSDKGISSFYKPDHTVKNIFSECAYCLLLDENNNIWAGTGSGLVRLGEEGQTQKYGITDGLQGLEFNTNACAISKSGKMYFGGLNGISVIDPRKVRAHENEQPLVIKHFSQGDKSILLNVDVKENLFAFTFPHDKNNVNFKLASRGKYEADAYNYQYYVKGITDRWIDGGDQTDYNFSLSPGDYGFYFASTHEYDANLPLGKPINVTIKNPFWATWWFYGLILIGLIGTISIIITSINKQKYLKEKYNLDLKINLQEERLNMSKELHDNIGSRLTFLVSSIGNIKPQKDNVIAEKNIERLSEFGRDTIDDLRSFMWVLSAEKITIQDLQLKTLDFIDIARNSYTDIGFSFQGVSLDYAQEILSSGVSQNAFRIIQEAVHNLVKHSHATKAEIIFELENGNFTIKIVDNGDGFDLEKSRKGFGLSNMKSRMKRIGGELKLESEIGVGTFVELIIKR
jgi:signal transduction histidine kinase